MGKMKKFMVVHYNPGIDCSVVQANWRKLAEVESAAWVRTYFNEEFGRRYCIWFADNKDHLADIFNKMKVSFESIVLVEETNPDLWGEKWGNHLELEALADTLGN